MTTLYDSEVDGFGSLTGTATVEASGAGYDWLNVPAGSAQAYITEDLGTPVADFAYRAYVHLFSAWPSASCNLAVGYDSAWANGAGGFAQGGSGSPGQVRFLGVGGDYAGCYAPNGTTAVSTVYRYEIRCKSSTDQKRGAVFAVGSDTPLYDSGWVAANVSPLQRLRFGRHTTVSTNAFQISRVKITDDADNWVGRDSSDITGPTAAASGAVRYVVDLTGSTVTGAATYACTVDGGLTVVQIGTSGIFLVTQDASSHTLTFSVTDTNGTDTVDILVPAEGGTAVRVGRLIMTTGGLK